jgi:hypothetical protein
MTACEAELRSLGPSRENDYQQRLYLINMAVKFQTVTGYALDTRYGTDDLFDNGITRLATIIVTLNDHFSEAVRKNGCTVDFDSRTTQLLNLGVPHQPKSSSKNRASKSKSSGLPAQTQSTSWFPDASSGKTATGFFNVNDYPELEDVLYDSRPGEPEITEEILSWIEGIYKSSRGFELGTFDPSISPLLFKQQTINWEHLAMDYICDVILHIHGFCDRLLAHICMEERTRSSLWAVLIEDMIPIYKKAIDQVKFIIRTEREGNLITTNHYFSENLEKARAERLKKASEDVPQIAATFGLVNLENVTTTDHLERISGISNLKHTVQDIHDILKAYYTVARKRFVDNVCMQATDYHLVSGPETPLKVFSPTFVGNLTSDQLEAIAGEDGTSIKQRRELHKQMESLRDGVKVLATC